MIVPTAPADQPSVGDRPTPAAASDGLGVLGGLFLLVIPGIYAYVLWVFNSQAVVVDGLKFRPALRRSGTCERM